ncbi:MAG TPA: 2-C-methyl-D-erythritol 2,4-cyclodiphosphate synthase [Gemmatimonadales bacterium]|nr:2-C-methyl-D-erythritol 2,4-cyclodiphosphate synthase [Gemmatimonadales bacterium]
MIRIGIGYDSHRFVEGRQLILGGQHIPHSMGLHGHSDADAVAHALTDAILGAAGAGNIGTLFPDTDPQWKNADSLYLLHLAVEHVRERGCEPMQADLTIITEGPRIGPYAEAMQVALARVLGRPASAVSVKAKSNEGMGFIGRGEGLAVIAVATVEER